MIEFRLNGTSLQARIQISIVNPDVVCRRSHDVVQKQTGSRKLLNCSLGRFNEDFKTSDILSIDKFDAEIIYFYDQNIWWEDFFGLTTFNFSRWPQIVGGHRLCIFYTQSVCYGLTWFLQVVSAAQCVSCSKEEQSNTLRTFGWYRFHPSCGFIMIHGVYSWNTCDAI